ncbi:hypothetical protein [Burkholderia pseudomallei]|uniref:hypothetical protein n=1 Tax=Burkholderia pseudomallei TaxID=28450 RepID=UPI0021564A4B|nr:hypothetical protein [Burkholderia pseudomallei]
MDRTGPSTTSDGNYADGADVCDVGQNGGDPDGRRVLPDGYALTIGLKRVAG